MSLFQPETDKKGQEHPVAVFMVVSFIVLATLVILSRATGGSAEEPRPLTTQAPSSGGGNLAAPSASEAAAPAITAEAAAPEAPAEDAAALEAVAAPEQPAPEAFAAAPMLAPSAPPPAVGARSFAVIDRSCGALAYGFNEHERLAPASLTKIVTALVVAKTANMDDVSVVDVSGSAMKKRGSSVMGIEPGQRYSLLDLLYGLMLPSGNDAALALAKHVGNGDVDAFVGMMNAEAQALGMANSHFSNPHGLDDAALYSSTYDMALAGRAALDIPLLWDVSNARNYTTSSGLAFRNGNKLLNTYPDVFGVKIGYTGNAKQTIVAAAERNGRQVIISVFGSADRYADTTALLDWTFDHVPSRC